MSDMYSKIIVMGGSFNPPTIAHMKLMQSAISQLSTGDFFEDIHIRGIFVPSSDAYFRWKMDKSQQKLIIPLFRKRCGLICWNHITN